MNDYDQRVENGRAMLREKDINFSKFKEMFAERSDMKPSDEDHWVDLYNDFAYYVWLTHMLMDDWIQFNEKWIKPKNKSI